MTTALKKWLLILSDNLYCLLLISYPPSFRRDYGLQMRQIFRDCSRDAYRQRSLKGLLTLWVHILDDLMVTAFKEHISALATLKLKGLIQQLKRRPQIEMERSMMMAWETDVNNHETDHAFSERIARVLGREPAYYQLLVSPEPTRRMGEVIESIALEGDMSEPETALTLFQELSEKVPEGRVDRWLAGLRDAAQRLAGSMSPDAATQVTDRLIRLIYANPDLYELVAATEPGYGLLEIVESLALEGDVDDIETMLGLMHQLAI